MSKKLRVAILDDHIVTVEGYVSMLEKDPQTEVAAKMNFGNELEDTLSQRPADILILDVNVPTSSDNRSPYPILDVIPRLLEAYPEMKILVISMHANRGLIRAVMDAGASGYILKDDAAVLRNLGSVLRTVAGGGIQLSRAAHDIYARHLSHESGDLSPRERQVLSLCAAYPNETTASLAQKLKVKNSTIRNLLSKAYMKLDVNSRAAAIAVARERGLITPYPPESPFPENEESSSRNN
jgi:two-component system nitrate/nitrite response regulator NarL